MRAISSSESSLGVEDHRHRVAGERTRGEDVDLLETDGAHGGSLAHVGDGGRAARRYHRSAAGRRMPISTPASTSAVPARLVDGDRFVVQQAAERHRDHRHQHGDVADACDRPVVDEPGHEHERAHRSGERQIEHRSEGRNRGRQRGGARASRSSRRPRSRRRSRSRPRWRRSAFAAGRASARCCRHRSASRPRRSRGGRRARSDRSSSERRARRRRRRR